MSLLASLIFASTLLAQCGCPATSKDHAYPDDPLFVTKKPLEMTPSPGTTQSPTLPALPEPQIPPMPAAVRLAAKQ
jgi:hypothetical protein